MLHQSILNNQIDLKKQIRLVCEKKLILFLAFYSLATLSSVHYITINRVTTSDYHYISFAHCIFKTILHKSFPIHDGVWGKNV